MFLVGEGVGRAGEELIVEDAVVFVGDQFSDDVQVLRLSHKDQVFGRVVQVARIVHVDVVAAAVPPGRFQIGHATERQRDRGRLVRRNGEGLRDGLVFEAV